MIIALLIMRIIQILKHMAGFGKMLSRYVFVFYGSFCPINMGFYDRRSSVDLKASIHLGTHYSSHSSQTTSHLPGPKKYLKNGLLWYWLGWAAAEVEEKPYYPGILKLTDPREISLVNPVNDL